MKRLLIAFFCFCFFTNKTFAETDDEILTRVLWPKVVHAPANKRPSVGIALAGGGARAFTHTGFLQAMEYASFPIDYIAGTSMGSIVGGYYAIGKPVSSLWALGEQLKKMPLKKTFSGTKLFSLFFKNKMMPADSIKVFAEQTFGDINIENLQKPFACVAMDIRTGEKVVFRSGSVALAVRASSNVPGLFEPLQHKQRYLVDGGVVENVPVDAVKAMGAQWVIASIDKITSEAQPDNVLSVLMQVIDVRGNMLATESEKRADFIVDPPVGHISTIAFDKCLEAAELGLGQAYKDMPAMKQAYMLRAIPHILEAER